MNYQEFLQRAQDYKKLLPALFAAIAALLAIIVMLIGLSFYLSKRHEVVLVPMHMTSTASIGSEAVSSKYLTAFALSVVSLRMNFTPDTVDEQYSYLLNFISGYAYGGLKKQFLQEVTNIKKRKISSSFAVSNIELKPKKLVVLITGMLNRTVDTVKLAPKQISLELHFTNQNGALSVTEFKESQP